MSVHVQIRVPSGNRPPQKTIPAPARAPTTPSESINPNPHGDETSDAPLDTLDAADATEPTADVPWPTPLCPQCSGQQELIKQICKAAHLVMVVKTPAASEVTRVATLAAPARLVVSFPSTLSR